uniref:Nuclear receptor domain-containing protein n=1 Tax=Caenorhabditis tropicalis TaxID=1561998 RepID=A0A1I7V2I1_9PELO
MESLPNLQICGVCGETADAVHFGALSCRACAAFFRRRVAAGKLIIVSRCAGNCKLENQLLRRLCASCRYEKCLRIGMKTSAVLSRLVVKTEPGSSTWMGECLLDQMKAAYARLESSRRDAFLREDHVPKITNYKEVNAMCSIDIDLIVLHYTSFFQSITPIDEEQRRYLGVHFLVPFCLLDGAFRSQGIETELFLMPNGDYVDLQNLDDFYQNPDEKEDNGIAGSVTTLMEPYWRLNNQVLRKHLKEVILDLSEFLFLFWDPIYHIIPGIQNQSDACIQICKQMRSRIFEELTNYEKNLNLKADHSMRVGEIVIVLQAVQKALGIMNECRDISMVYNLYGRECPLFRVPQNSEFNN